MEKNYPKKNVLVFGLGPCGGIMAANLAHAGHHVTGIDPWEEHIGVIRRQGLSITHINPVISFLKGAFTHIKYLEEKEFDYLIIAVKTPKLPGVLEDIKKFSSKAGIVVMQNGLDNENLVAQVAGEERTVRVAVNYAGNITAPGTIKMNFFQVPNQVGSVGSRGSDSYAVDFAELAMSSHLETQFVEDIRNYTWKKTILNAILAPISALLGITMADVMNDPCTRTIVESLIRESIAVGKAEGYDYGEGFYDHCLEFLLKAGAHKPSMLIDIENGNPTEIDYINGKIAEYGAAHGIPVPFNTTMTALVKARSRHKRRK